MRVLGGGEGYPSEGGGGKVRDLEGGDAYLLEGDKLLAFVVGAERMEDVEEATPREGGELNEAGELGRLECWKEMGEADLANAMGDEGSEESPVREFGVRGLPTGEADRARDPYRGFPKANEVKEGFFWNSENFPLLELSLAFEAVDCVGVGERERSRPGRPMLPAAAPGVPANLKKE